jgi:hypothetical protein
VFKPTFENVNTELFEKFHDPKAWFEAETAVLDAKTA